VGHLDQFRDELRKYTFPKTDDPVIRARQKMVVEWALESSPEVREEIQLQDARGALRRVLKARHLVLATEDHARIDACTDAEALGRWLEQAVVAASTAEALR
jgi:hypothetical protein